MASTSHAEHFLSRIDRLNTWQAELVLGLYRDEELLQLVLTLADLPEGAERIAISLSEGDCGPYVIVTRRGKFVTCLGEGMKLHPEQPLIGQHKFEKLCGQVEHLRVMFAEARSGRRQRCEQLLLRITDAGNDVTQPEFDDMVVLGPFVGHLFVRTALDCQQTTDEIWHELSRLPRLGKHLDPVLKLHWQHLWAGAHFTLLMGAEPRFARMCFEFGDARDAGKLRRGIDILPMWPWLTQVMPWSLRGAWFAAQLPKLFVRRYKEMFCSASTHHELCWVGLSLAAIGHRHQRYHAEMHKFFQSATARGGSHVALQTREVASALASTFERREPGVRTKEVDASTDALLTQYAREHVPAHTSMSYVLNLPPEAKRALALSLPIPVSPEPKLLSQAMTWLPVVAKMQARDFYLPAKERYRLIKQEYDYRTGLAYVSTRLSVHAPAPVRSAALPGRNEPCHCGSGKKFKRCCASGQRAIG